VGHIDFGEGKRPGVFAASARYGTVVGTGTVPGTGTVKIRGHGTVCDTFNHPLPEPSGDVMPLKGNFNLKLS
jgi:hypothetical protein